MGASCNKTGSPAWTETVRRRLTVHKTTFAVVKKGPRLSDEAPVNFTLHQPWQ